VASIIQVRRDLAANWTTNDPTLASGEMGLETDTHKVKFGDGATAWASLLYFDAGANFALINDTTPQLGGNLDLNTFVITGLQIGTDVQAYSAFLDPTSSVQTQLDAKAPIASPTFTGTVTLPAATVVNVVNDTTPQLGGDLDCNGNQLLISSYQQIADASLGTGTHTFNYASGDMQQLTATGNITIAFSGFPTGSVASMIIDAVNWGAWTITFPAGLIFDAATAPTFTAVGIDRLLVLKDKDDIYSMFIIGQGIA